MPKPLALPRDAFRHERRVEDGVGVVDVVEGEGTPVHFRTDVHGQHADEFDGVQASTGSGWVVSSCS